MGGIGRVRNDIDACRESISDEALATLKLNSSHCANVKTTVLAPHVQAMVSHALEDDQFYKHEGSRRTENLLPNVSLSMKEFTSAAGQTFITVVLRWVNFDGFIITNMFLGLHAVQPG